MPNHVINRVKFLGAKDQVKQLKESIKSDSRVFDFEKIVVPPENLYRGSIRLGVRYDQPTWYDWNISNWGTKWNSYDGDDTGDYIEFQTAWSIPHPVYVQLSKNYPDVIINVTYADEDIGHNCGVVEYRVGESYELEPEESPEDLACRLHYNKSYAEYQAECEADYEDD